MDRKLVWGLLAAGGVSVILAVTVAVVGSKLDDAQLERDHLEVELDELPTEAASLRSERDALASEQAPLKSQVDDQLRTIEQLKAELDRAHAQVQQPAQVEPPQ